MTDPLPLPWYLFFGVAEPESTIANAVSALGYTKTFYRYFLLALLSLFFSILRRPTIAAAHKESLLAAVLLALAAAGWIHVGVTFYFLSASPAVVTMSGLFAEMAKPANWDGLFFGKIVDTFLLFTARTAWFLGIARDSPSSTSSQKQQNHKKAT